MIRNYFILTLSLIFLVAAAQPSSAGWPIYSHPEFRGRIIDAETKEPIEGAVAVVYYSADMLIGGPGGPGSYVFHARECLTDKNGEFFFPSHTSVHVISEGGRSAFIFYKPGYKADYGPININVNLMVKYFSSGKPGEAMQLEGGTPEQGSYVKWKGPIGIVELKKAKTREDKWKAPLVFKSSMKSEDLPLLHNAIDEAENNLKAEGIK